MSEYVVDIKDLSVSFYTYLGEVQAVRGVSFRVKPGEMLGIVGESGSGKSVTSLSLMGLLQHPGKIKQGEIHFNGVDLAKKTNKQMKEYRGQKISMVFQDPMTAMNPVLKIGFQMVEGIRTHQNMSKKEARKLAVELLNKVKIPSPEKRLDNYPFELSGGMRQRVMFAMAIANNPQLLIADEPTTALDVTIQKQVLQLMNQLNREMNSAVMLITHDLGVIAETCSRVVVMYGGMIMEEGTTDEIFYSPRHPYTIALQKSIPNPTDDKQKRLYSIPGSPPNMTNPPKGCPFADRCEYAMKICTMYVPEYVMLSETHRSMCWRLSKESPKKL